MWSSVFATRIITKEKRMERWGTRCFLTPRYPEWKQYKERTNCILPIKFFLHFFRKEKAE